MCKCGSILANLLKEEKCDLFHHVAVIARPSFVISADVVVVVVGGRGHRVVRCVVLPRMGMLRICYQSQDCTTINIIIKMSYQMDAAPWC